MPTIKKEDIEKYCKESMVDFVEYFPNGIDFEWTKLHQWVMLYDQRLRRWWGFSVFNGLIPSWNMAFWYFRNADLSEADLRGAELSEANLSEANLWRSNLRGANLREANLWRANLREANLSEAELREAKRLDADHKIPGWKVENGILVKE
jgi:uncharacterized protein YjbI with pentapeptide repeats